MPSHESATLPEEDGSYPTASQNVAETHDTPLRLFTSEGVCGLDQDVPSHENATPSLERLLPTTSQNVAETHDTPSRASTPDGANWLDQSKTFPESAMPPDEFCPTAIQ